MISICCPYYPYWRDVDRTNELFDVLIPAMMRADRRDELELVILDAGIQDIWQKPQRPRDPIDFYTRLCKAWHGDLVYELTNQAITPSKHKTPNRFWMANAVNCAIKNANHENIFIQNMDIEIPVDFVEQYERNVAPGQVWFPHCYHIKRSMPRVHQMGGWRSGRGLVGITKTDYWAVGGTDHVGHVKDRHDSDLYLRCKAKYKFIEENCEGLFHIDHPGSNEGKSEFKGNW